MYKNINKNQPQGVLHTYLYDPNVYTSVVMKIRRKSQLSVYDVKEAIELAYTQNETTMSKVVLNNGEAYFEKMPMTGCRVFFDNRDWIETINESEKHAFRINEGELVRSFIYDNVDDISVLIMAHKIVGDGNALALFAKDILSNLAGESVEYKPLNNSGEEGMSSDMKLPFFKKLGINVANSKWEKTGKTFDWEDYYCLHRRFWDNKKTYAVSATIKGTEYYNIIEECKNLGISVNSYVLAKQLEKIPRFTSIGMPVSYRGSNTSLANKEMPMKMNCEYNTQTSFERNAKEIHNVIQKSISNSSSRYEERLGLLNIEPTLLDGALMEKYTSYRNEIAKKMCDVLGYSEETKVQLGAMNLDNANIKTEYEAFELKDFVYIPAPTTSTRNVISISTLPNSISVCCCSVK